MLCSRNPVTSRIAWSIRTRPLPESLKTGWRSGPDGLRDQAPYSPLRAAARLRASRSVPST